MLLKEKILYHQIHPLKLLTDFSAGVFTTYYCGWQSVISNIFRMGSNLQHHDFF